MEYQTRVQVWIKYLYEQGIDDGLYLAEVPYRNLNPAQRRRVWNDAKRHALTGLLPVKHTKDGRDFWILVER